MNMLQVIMAHGKAQATFDRHLPTWEKLGHEMLIFCPEDDMISTRHPVYAFGHACHHGPHSIERFRALLRFLERTSADHFLVQEYDSFSLETPQISKLSLRGNSFQEDDPKWLGKMFIHPPLAFDRSALKRLNMAASVISDEAEGSYWDRVLSVYCQAASVPVHGWGWVFGGFSQNTIEPEQIKDAVAAKQAGVTQFHGVKTQECLDAIMNA